MRILREMFILFSIFDDVIYIVRKPPLFLRRLPWFEEDSISSSEMLVKSVNDELKEPMVSFVVSSEDQ